MNRKQYETMRNQLMNEAQTLINDGKAEEAEAKMNEVKELDEKWDKIAQAQANFNALNNDPKPMSPFEMTGSLTGNEGTENPVSEAWASKEYENAWAKTMMKNPLEASEQKTFAMVNEAYTHTTGNTAVVIPKSVVKGIWEEAGNLYPYFNDVNKTYVNGVLAVIQEDTSTDAGWYDEATATDDGKETLKEFTLSGCELARSVTISWKLREMAVEDFIPYIRRKIAKKMGAAAGYGATHGAGPKAASGKPEPTGTVTALLAEAGTPQVVTYTKGSVPTWKELTSARAKVKSGYGAGLAVYANSTTIWNVLANILDQNKRPIFMTDAATGVNKVLGATVKEDDSMLDGEILFSNAYEGYHTNVNKEMTVMTEEHVKERKADYCAYAIMDGNVTTTKAHALLKEATA